MKYVPQSGIAPLVIILIIAIFGGATYAVVPREVLKEYFAIGDKPNEEQAIVVSEQVDTNVEIKGSADAAAESGVDVVPAVPKTPVSKVYNATKEYIIGDSVVKSETIYQAKVLSQTQTEFKLDAAQPVTFRWTPVVPKPQEPVTYRIKVWQLMQGQSGTQAMRTNKPAVVKDVDNVTEATVSGIYTGPCKPPYLCDFVWSAEVVAKAGVEAQLNTQSVEIKATVDTGANDSSSTR